MKKNRLLLQQGVFSLNSIIFAEISVEVPLLQIFYHTVKRFNVDLFCYTPTPFSLQNLILHDINSTRCWKHSRFLFHINMIASHSGFTSKNLPLYRFSIRLGSDDCGGHLSTVNMGTHVAITGSVTILE